MQTAQVNSAATSPQPARAALDYAHPWLPDRGEGTYCNPVLYADYSDPDVIRVGHDFWLTASSFNCTPGLPILHSEDLVNWRLVGHALKNLPHPRYEQVQPGCGVWAPAIRFHAGRYWIFYPTPDEGIFVVTADHPAGPWSAPHCVQEGKGLIDPCPLWDDDGQAYLVHAYAGSRAGIKHRLRVCPMAPDGSKLLGEGEVVFHQPEKHPTIEGPKFLKKDGWYYLLAPAGGVETGWQVALRSRQIYGPYEDKVVLSQGQTQVNGPHQGALVDTAAGDWWFLHFQDADLYGRVTHLQPATWREGWPLIGHAGQPVDRHAIPLLVPGHKPCAPDTTDEFTISRLGLQWQWHANHRDDWYSLTARPGWLRLFPQPAAAHLGGQPNHLLQKFPARSFLAEVTLEFASRQSGEEAGLVVTGGSQAMIGVRRNGIRNEVIFRTNASEQVVSGTASNALVFRVCVQDGGRCAFAFSDGGDFVALPWVFQARKGTWIGAKLGLHSVQHTPGEPAGWVDWASFRFT